MFYEIQIGQSSVSKPVMYHIWRALTWQSVGNTGWPACHGDGGAREFIIAGPGTAGACSRAKCISHWNARHADGPAHKRATVRLQAETHPDIHRKFKNMDKSKS